MPLTDTTNTTAQETSPGRRKSVVAPAQDWVAVQKKTFTRWANQYLARKGLQINDLNVDLGDGINLHALLETIGDEKLPKINKKPRMRIQKLENLSRAFDYLKKKEIKLVGIGSSDLLDGHEKLILGLVWTIILRFEVADAGDKAGLLLWCKRSTQGYNGVNVKNFTHSWNDGKAFCALINRYRPDLLDFEATRDESSEEALERAFRVAEEELGINRFLDVEDIADNVRPDEKSVVAYVTQFFKLFAGAAKNEQLVKCIAKAVGVTQRHQQWISAYNDGISELLSWVQGTAADHANRGDEFALGDSTEAVKAKLDCFRAHLREVKPEQHKKKVELEGIYNTLASSARNNNRPSFAPTIKPETLQVCWEALEEADRVYERDLLDRLTKFQRADAETSRFAAKAKNVGPWLDEKLAFFAEAAEHADEVEGAHALETRKEAHVLFQKRFEQYAPLLIKMRKMADAVPEYAPGHAQAARMAEEICTLEIKSHDVDDAGAAYLENVESGLARENELLRLGRDFDKDSEQLQFDLDQVHEDLSVQLGGGVTVDTDSIRDATVQLVPLKVVLENCASRVASLESIAEALAGPGAARRPEAAEVAAHLRSHCDERVEQMNNHKENLAGLLEKEEAKDVACLHFAKLAEEFQSFCSEQTAQNADDTEGTDDVQSLEEQQAELRARMADCAERAEPLLAGLEEADAACEAACVVVNPHTGSTMNGLRGVFDTLNKVLRRTDESLTAQILANKSTEVSPEQLKEIKEVFEYFDEDKSGELDLHELIEGCKGAGFDMTDGEVEKKLRELGGKNADGELYCNLDQFTQFMLDQLQTGDGAVDVLEAFKELTGASDTITAGSVDRLFGSLNGVAPFMHEHMPVAEGKEGYDYSLFTAHLFTC